MKGIVLMINFAYLCSLIFIIIFICYLIKVNFEKCPRKVKKFFAIALGLLALRYVAVLIGALIDEQAIVYLLRHFILSDYFVIPLLILGILYIFLRDENKTFDYNFIFMIILLILYIALLIIYKVNISIDNIFGFVITFKNSLTPNLIYLIIMASLAVVSLLYIDKPHSNKWGMRILTAVLMISIIEFVIFLGGIKLFPYPIIGDVLALLLSYKAIKTFK